MNPWHANTEAKMRKFRALLATTGLACATQAGLAQNVLSDEALRSADCGTLRTQMIHLLLLAGRAETHERMDALINRAKVIGDIRGIHDRACPERNLDFEILNQMQADARSNFERARISEPKREANAPPPAGPQIFRRESNSATELFAAAAQSGSNGSSTAPQLSAPDPAALAQASRNAVSSVLSLHGQVFSAVTAAQQARIEPPINNPWLNPQIESRQQQQLAQQQQQATRQEQGTREWKATESTSFSANSAQDKSKVIKGNGQPATHCVILRRITKQDPGVGYGGGVFDNTCGATVAVSWCYVDRECGRSGGARWNIAAGRSWPVEIERQVRYGACFGSNTISEEKGTAGLRYICDAPTR